MSAKFGTSMQERKEIRRLQLADVPDGLELSRLAGWNQTDADWRRMLALAPDGCFCVEANGHVVASATLVTYQQDCAWLGMVLTHPDWRSRGYARQLVGYVLEVAHSRAIPCIKLDATGQGQPLYESFGFRVEQPVERWERPGSLSFAASSQTCFPLADEAAYGYCRTQLLSSLGQVVGKENGSYVLTRPGAVRSYLGPCIAQDRDDAARLISPIIEGIPSAGWFWDLLPENRDAVELASTLGFRRVRTLARMRLGSCLREQEQQIYALAGFEFG
jgi:GNAT superfamily N-acetyltransferase